MAAKKKTTKKSTEQKEQKEQTRKSPVTSKTPWFQTGTEGLKEKRKLDQMNELRSQKNMPRFRLKAGEEALIVFVDDTGFYAKVHQFEMDGNWGNFLTCVKDFQPCELCNSGKRPTYTAHYTVIDTREFTKRDGTKVKNNKILFPAKGSVIQMVADLKRKYTSLAGRVFKVKRYSSNDPNCGNYFELVSNRKINLVQKFGKDADKPLDYMTILQPPTEEELAALGFGSTPVGVEEEMSDDELAEFLD